MTDKDYAKRFKMTYEQIVHAIKVLQRNVKNLFLSVGVLDTRISNLENPLSDGLGGGSSGGSGDLGLAEILNGKVDISLVNAKGDLLVATADNSLDRLAVGTDAYVLTADSNETSGLKWAEASGGVTTYTTVTLAEAATGSDNDLIYVVENETVYRYEETGNIYAVDDLFILSTGAGGDTRWVGVAGKYNINSTKSTAVEDIFTATPSQTEFTLSQEPLNEACIILAIDSALQGTDTFTYSGTTLTLDTAMDGGEKVVVKYNYGAEIIIGTKINTITKVEDYDIINGNLTNYDELVIYADATSNTVYSTLPLLADNQGKKVTVKVVNDNNLSKLIGKGAETIDGASEYNLANLHDYVTVIGETSEWKVISETGGTSSSSTIDIETDNTGSAYTIDLGNGTCFELTLTDNCTFTFPSTGTAGELGQFWIYLKRDATPDRTVTWDTDVKWAMDIVPALDGTASTLTIFRFTQLGNSSRWYGEVLSMGVTI